MTWPTIDELAAYMQTSFTTSAQVATATQNLEIAKAAVQADTGQTIELVEDDAITLDGNSRELLLLPQIPVISIATVSFKSSSSATVETLDVDDDYYWSTAGLLRRLPYGLNWGTARGGASVTYSHGYTEIPAAIRGVVLSAAARLQINPDSSLQSETIGNYSYTRRDATASTNGAGGFLTDAERSLLDPYRALVLVP